MYGKREITVSALWEMCHAHAAGKMSYFSLILWFYELFRIVGVFSCCMGDFVVRVNFYRWILQS
jgi:hypothetical protein